MISLAEIETNKRLHAAAAAAAAADEPVGAKSVKARGGVKFGAADTVAEAEADEAAAEEGRGSEDDEGPARGKKGKVGRV
jgi:hypothetical protein